MVEEGVEIVLSGSENDRMTGVPADIIVDIKYSSPGVCSFTELTYRIILETS